MKYFFKLYWEEILVFFVLWYITGFGIAFATFLILVSVKHQITHKIRIDNMQNIQMTIKTNAICKKLGISENELNEKYTEAIQNINPEEWKEMSKTVYAVVNY